jgi:cytolysin-activating lysine-acyltransferase
MAKSSKHKPAKPKTAPSASAHSADDEGGGDGGTGAPAQTVPAPQPAPTGPLSAAQFGKQVDVTSIIGQIVILMMRSHTHKFTPMADLEWMVLPAIALRQFRLYRDSEQRIVAFAAWAFLSEEIEQRLKSTAQPRLAPKDWKSGDRAWLLDVIGPPGYGPAILEDLRNGMLSRHRIHFHRTTPDGVRHIESVLGKGVAGAAA